MLFNPFQYTVATTKQSTEVSPTALATF